MSEMRSTARPMGADGQQPVSEQPRTYRGRYVMLLVLWVLALTALTVALNQGYLARFATALVILVGLIGLGLAALYIIGYLQTRGLVDPSPPPADDE